ncbi:hypothetical protein FACS1894211_11660 [Clostridia bacterium]|nr:hypothetical protein FACS1894211_11660 [Clostridia bacterium]
MGVWIKKMFLQIIVWILRFLDALFKLFRILIGIEPVKSGQNEGPLVDLFLQSDPVVQAFIGLFIIAIGICSFCVIVAVIKNMINLGDKERKPHLRTVGQGLGAILTTLLMATVMTFGIYAFNTVLAQAEKYLPTGQEPVSSIIFDFSVEKGYVLDPTVPLYDDDGEFIGYDYLYTGGRDVNGEPIGDPVVSSGWFNGKMPDDFDINNLDPDKIYGEFGNSWFMPDAKKHKDGTGLIRIDSFNFLVAYIGSVVMLVVVGLSMLSLVKRLYDLVILFITLPVVMATIPLDDGAKFKAWRETVVSKIILAYASLVSVNVFLMAVPLINSIDSASLGGVLIGTVFKLFLLIGGGLAIHGGQLLIARIFGTSAEEGREMGQAARGLIAGGMAAGGAARGIKNTLFGGHSKYGVERKGILPGAGRAAAGVTNTAGRFLGGNTYQRGANYVGGIKDRLANSLRLGSGRAGQGSGGGASNGATGSQSALSDRPWMKSGGLVGKIGHAIKGESGEALTQKARDYEKHLDSLGRAPKQGELRKSLSLQAKAEIKEHKERDKEHKERDKAWEKAFKKGGKK